MQIANCCFEELSAIMEERNAGQVTISIEAEEALFIRTQNKTIIYFFQCSKSFVLILTFVCFFIKLSIFSRMKAYSFFVDSFTRFIWNSLKLNFLWHEYISFATFPLKIQNFVFTFIFYIKNYFPFSVSYCICIFSDPKYGQNGLGGVG